MGGGGLLPAAPNAVPTAQASVSVRANAPYSTAFVLVVGALTTDHPVAAAALVANDSTAPITTAARMLERDALNIESLHVCRRMGDSSLGRLALRTFNTCMRSEEIARRRENALN
jgi:hypothetical protein